MIIEITSSDTKAPEWVILELQGGVQPLSQTTGKGALQQSIASAERALDGCLMGNVSLLAGNKAALQIGNHRVTGDVIELAKPLILIHRASSSVAAGSAPSYAVRAIIRRKLLFKDRPQPQVSARI